MTTAPEFQRLIGRLRWRHLALLERLGKDPNLGRAARQLHMTQPTASKLLREIETIFDDTLFERNRRGMTPTLAGTTLTRRAGILLAELEATQSALLAAKQGAAARLRMGIFPVAIPEFLPRFFRQLRQYWPGLHVSVVEATEYPLLAQLAAGEIDCIIGRIVLETLPPELRHEALYDEPTVIVCGVEHPLLAATTPERQLAILEASRWMLPAPHGTIYSMVASWLARRGGSAPIVEVQTTSVFTTIEMLNHLPLLSILPRNVAHVYAELGKVAEAPEGDLSTNFPVGLMYRADAASSPLIQSALAAARAC